MIFSGVTMGAGFSIIAPDPFDQYTQLILKGESITGGTVFTDRSTNNFTFTVNGGTIPTNSNPYAGSAYFDGSGDYLTVSSSTAFDQDTDFTIEMWVYILTYPSGSYDAKVYHPNGSGALAIAISTAGKINIDDQQVGNKIVSVATLNKNSWYHIALVRNGPTTNNLKLYINGALDSTVSYSNWQSSPTQVVIGRRVDTSTDYNGHISNLRVVKGTAVYTSAFTPSTIPLTAITNTVLLTCQSNGLVDNSINNLTITNTGNTTSIVFDPFAGSGYYSAYFDGNGDYLTSPSNTAFALSTTDFTIECWIYPTAWTNDSGTIIDFRQSGQGSSQVEPRISLTNGTLAYYVNGANRITTTLASTNRWYHVAVVKSSGSTKLYVNGTQAGSTYTDTNDYGTSAQDMVIGQVGDSRGFSTGYYTGYISDIRIVKGTAVYTSNFTPPTSPSSDISGTSLLTLQYNGGTIIDSSNNNFTMTRTSGAVISTAQYKYGTSSLYFPGNGVNNIYTPSTSILSLGQSQAFTIEFWMYPTNTDNGSNGKLFPIFGTPNITNYNTVGGFVLSLVRFTSGASDYQIRVDVSTGGGNDTILWNTTNPNSWTQNTWTHVAWDFNGTTHRLYCNGVQKDTQTQSSLSFAETQFNIGGYPKPTGFNPVNLYMDDVRVTIGANRYNSNFTPPGAF